MVKLNRFLHWVMFFLNSLYVTRTFVSCAFSLGLFAALNSNQPSRQALQVKWLNSNLYRLQFRILENRFYCSTRKVTLPCIPNFRLNRWHITSHLKLCVKVVWSNLWHKPYCFTQCDSTDAQRKECLYNSEPQNRVLSKIYYIHQRISVSS